MRWKKEKLQEIGEVEEKKQKRRTRKKENKPKGRGVTTARFFTGVEFVGVRGGENKGSWKVKAERGLRDGSEREGRKRKFLKDC